MEILKKRILLRFENSNRSILTYAIITMLTGLVTGIAFFHSEIAAGCITAILCAGSIAVFLHYVLRREVIIDFEHNLLEMRKGNQKERCELDQVKNLEIVFHWVQKRNCYAAQVFAYLQNGNTIAIKIYPKLHVYRSVYYSTGRVTGKLKSRIEKQVQGYDFITCRTRQ